MNSLTHVLLFLAILTVIVLVSTVWENLYWQRKQPERMYGLKEILVNFSLGASYKLFDAVAVALYVFALYDLIKPYGLNIQNGDSWLWFPVLYVIVDFCFYLTHLAMHKIRWFWASHVTHHSSDRYNFSVALRQNFTVVLNGSLLIWWLPLALVGFDRELVLLAMEINLLFQFLLHTEAPSPLNRFGLILNTPSHHRVHHGCGADQIDRNFGGTFILWDRLFGTFRSEDSAGELKYGVTRRMPHSHNPLVLVFHEWRDLLSDLRRTRDLRILYRGPAWIEQLEKTENIQNNNNSIAPEVTHYRNQA